MSSSDRVVGCVLQPRVDLCALQERSFECGSAAFVGVDLDLSGDFARDFSSLDGTATLHSSECSDTWRRVARRHQ